MSDQKVRSALDLLGQSLEKYGGRIALASSFGVEDMLLLDLMSRITAHPPVFTLDTARLPDETYALIEETRRRYQPDLRVYFPNQKRVETMVRKHGPNLFYESVDNRKLCCAVRKVKPLQRALKSLSAWITGLRREQSANRQRLQRLETDDEGRVKINPLLEWTTEEVWGYIQRHGVPYNPLHDQGFASIGCAPCTRAVRPGEDARAGRWWWENGTGKECGLHAD